MSPDNRIAFVCDLGLDKVMCYRFDAEHGKLTPAEPAFVSLKPGAGPRHMVFRPDGKFAYVINELNSTVTSFAYDPQSGKLTEVQSDLDIAWLLGRKKQHGGNRCAPVGKVFVCFESGAQQRGAV